MDLSFPPGASVNSVIPKDTYLDAPVKLTFPSVHNLVALVRKHGRGCALFKRDLKRAYRQIPVDPGNMHLLGYSWDRKLFFDRVLPMGFAQRLYAVSGSPTSFHMFLPCRASTL